MIKTIANLEQKCENLERKQVQTNTNSNKITNVHQKSPPFPPFDSIPSNKYRDYYSNLLQSYRQLFEEKEQILMSLRQETIRNEEQKNHIEILKQTLESKIVKHGLSSLIDKSKYVIINLIKASRK